MKTNYMEYRNHRVVYLRMDEDTAMKLAEVADSFKDEEVTDKRTTPRARTALKALRMGLHILEFKSKK
jgi:hypothetical protein|tara:strand:- start:233 stop:436 length:204 start_codon:yes stop_codon:yes gene_type:complete